MSIGNKYFQFSQKTLIPSHSFLLKDAEEKKNEAQYFIHISQSKLLNLLLEVHKGNCHLRPVYWSHKQYDSETIRSSKNYSLIHLAFQYHVWSCSGKCCSSSNAGSIAYTKCHSLAYTLPHFLFLRRYGVIRDLFIAYI